MADRRRRRGRGDPVHLPVPAHGLRARLLDAGERAEPLPDRQDDEHTERPRRRPTSCRTTARRWPSSRTRPPKPASRSAGAGLLGNNQPGFELFEKQKLGESNFQQQVTYQRALQGQLDETINSIQGVSGAQVELVLPSSTNQVFGEGQGASAAVLLSGTTSVDHSSVRGIAQLVSSSVPGLQLSKVTVTDGSGQLLWPQSSGSDGCGSGTSVQDAEQRYDQATAASLDAMLAQTLGVGKAQVLVYANMNVDQTTKESLEYGKTGTPLAQSKSLETLAGNGAGAGATGTANTTAASSGGKSNYKKETSTSSLGVDKTVTHSTIAPGTVESQHVSVLLDHSVPAGVAARDQGSGHQRRRYPGQARRHHLDRPGRLREEHAARSAAAASPLGYAKYALLGIAAIVFLFLTTRSLRRREQRADRGAGLAARARRADAPGRARTRSLARGRSKSAPATDSRRPSGRWMNGARGGDEIRRQVEQLADNDPDRVAQQLRTWMQED